MAGTWRSVAGPIIARVLRETQGKSPAEVRKALKDAYPFGSREHWPYTVWLDEIKRQRQGRPSRPTKAQRTRASDTATLDLFGGGER